MNMRGIIYAIDSASLKKTYIGSTSNMYMRRAYHSCAGNMGASRAVVDGGDAVFRIVEVGEFANLRTLEAREAEYIRLYAGAYTLVNKKRYGRVEHIHDDDLWRVGRTVCECGVSYLKSCKSHHEKTRKHRAHVVARAVVAPLAPIAEVAEVEDAPAVDDANM